MAPQPVTSKARLPGGHPIHPMLIPLPIGFLIGAFAADVVVALTGSDSWAAATPWLLGAGIVTGLVAAVPGVIDYLGRKRVRELRTARLHGIGNALALLVSTGNLLGRLDDPLEFIVPVGLLLSAVVAGILGFTGWWGGELSYRHGVGVIEEA